MANLPLPKEEAEEKHETRQKPPGRSVLFQPASVKIKESCSSFPFKEASLEVKHKLLDTKIKENMFGSFAFTG